MLKIIVNEKVSNLISEHEDSLLLEIDTLLYESIKKNNKNGRVKVLLNFIKTNLKGILTKNTNYLRKIIKEFNLLLVRNSYLIKIIKESDLTDSLTFKELKYFCQIGRVKGYSKYKNKEELSRHLFKYVIENDSYIKKKINIHTENKKVITMQKKHEFTLNIFDIIKFKVFSTKVNNILNDIFVVFYEKKWNDLKEYDKYKFLEELGIKTCPYCNRNYISTVNIEEKKVRTDIDHFFPKSIYPYLAMSFYNLLPSCKVCNQLKGSKDSYRDKLLSPYEIDYNKFNFTYKTKNINFSNIRIHKFKVKERNLEIKLRLTNELIEADKITNNVYFMLEKLYQDHSDVVLDLLVKKTIYTKSYLEELKRNFGLNKEEVYRFLLSNYLKNEDLHKRTLSKLIQDISKELKLI